jgi:hypothetical protein
VNLSEGDVERRQKLSPDRLATLVAFQGSLARARRGRTLTLIEIAAREVLPMGGERGAA